MNEEQVTEPVQEPQGNPEQNSGTEETKTFTQDEVDRILKDRLARERNKLMKNFEDVDVEEYRNLKAEQERKAQEEQAKRGEFEKILQTTVEKKDSVIGQLQAELHAVKVDGNLLNAASRHKAVNPEQVVKLLKEQVKLNEAGSVDILDADGTPRYKDDGRPYEVDDLVNEFLTQNPHFKNATPSGSGTTGQIAGDRQPGGTDISNLDMNNPKHREIYREHMKSRGIRI